MSLSVPLFVTVADVVERMQINDSLTDVDNAITSALMGAHVGVEKLLGAGIAAKARDCTFFLDSTAFSGIQPGGFFRLEMPSCWIRTDQPITITYDDTWNLVNPQTAPTTDYQIDYDRGYIMLDSSRSSGNDFMRYYVGTPGQSYRNKYVRVQCTTGFNQNVPTPSFTGTPALWDVVTAYAAGAVVYVTLGGTQYLAAQGSTGQNPANNPTYWTPIVYGPEAIPSPLYEAIMTYVPLLMNAGQATNRNAQAKDQYQTLTDHCFMLLKDYVRAEGFSFRPSRGR